MDTKRENAVRAACDCCGVSRREFLATGAACAGALCAAMPGPAGAAGPRNPSSATDQAALQVAFVRPDVDKYHMGWPGAMYDIKARTADYTRVLTEAAKKLAMKLAIHPKPLWDDATADAFLQSVNQLELRRSDGRSEPEQQARSHRDGQHEGESRTIEVDALQQRQRPAGHPRQAPDGPIGDGKTQ